MMTSAAYGVVMYVVVVYAVMTYLQGCTPDEDHMDQNVVYIKFCPKTSAASLDYSFLLCSLEPSKPFVVVLRPHFSISGVHGTLETD